MDYEVGVRLDEIKQMVAYLIEELEKAKKKNKEEEKK